MPGDFSLYWGLVQSNRFRFRQALFCPLQDTCPPPSKTTTEPFSHANTQGFIDDKLKLGRYPAL